VNPDKRCTFNCVYCQVDRTKEIKNLQASADRILKELNGWLSDLVENGNTYQGHTLRDISIAGDGEPTTFRFLPDLIAGIVELKRKFGLARCKIVLFSNGGNLGRTDLQRVLKRLFDNEGEIWVKLDFWDEPSLRFINRTRIPRNRLMDNIVHIGKQYPIVFQSCFFSWNSERYDNQKYGAYVEQVKRILKKGVKIKYIQAYTLARKPADERAKPWSDKDMDRLSRYLRENLPVDVKTYYEKGD